MTDALSQHPAPFATRLGLGLIGFAILWWFIYYAQWQGAFGLLSTKMTCLESASRECMFMQQHIRGSIPTYSPLVWWAGLAAFVVGFVQSRCLSPRSSPGQARQ